MASWNIYSKEGTLKYVAKSIEYHEEWMVSDSVEISVTSPSPINFEVGDYLTYRGLRYSIYSLPSTLKTSRLNTYGDGFKWEGVRFYSDTMRLTEIRFLDYVLNDNELHYSSLPKFAFYAETVDDLIDRIQANADQVESGWVFLTPNLQRTLQRYDQSASSDISSLWHQCYGENGEHVDLGKNVTNVNISVSNNNLSEGLAMVYNQFGINYVCRDKVVIIGMSAMEAGHVFKYGKGNGLYEIERVADSDQQIVTRLYAYGSDKNLPLHYYAELNVQVFDTVSEINVVQDEDYAIHVDYKLDLKYSNSLFTNNENVSFIAVAQKHSVKVSSGGYEITAVAYHYDDSDDLYLMCVYSQNHDYGEGSEKSLSNLRGFMNSISVGGKIYFTGYVNKEAFPVANREYGTQNLPNNMAISTLMLPGFPLYALNEVCKSVYDSENGVTKIYYRKKPTLTYTEDNVIMTLEGNHLIGFSSDRYRPYIESPNLSVLGVKEGIVEFTEDTDENGLQEVYPTIEGMTKGEVFGTLSDERLDEVAGATMIEDNGVFGEGKIPNFNIVLKNIGFDLKEAFVNAGKDMTISMKDGYCGGRDFNVESVTQDSETGNWVLNVSRSQDSALGLYFPYSYHVSIGSSALADEPYQIREGDHFVLTGIDLADTTYVEAASIRALKKAISWLLNNDYMRYTYMPKVDEIFMARERDNAVSNNQTPLHDILKGGMLIHFQDTDLDIDSSIFIDNITIKEGDSAVPTYDIVLREEKTVSTLQRVLNQISNYASSGGGGGGGSSMTAGQVRSIVENLIDGRFLSRLQPDTAQGKITFADGIAFEGDYGIDKNGDATLRDIEGRNAEFATETIAGGQAEGDIVATYGETRDSLLNGQGTLITDDGRVQTTKMEVRGTLTVLDLIASQIHSLDGYYYFSDTMKIETVTEVLMSTHYDGVAGEDIYKYWKSYEDYVAYCQQHGEEASAESELPIRYLLTFEKEYENDFLKFYNHDILLSIRTDLTDESDSDDREQGEGGNTMRDITAWSWMLVDATSEQDKELWNEQLDALRPEESSPLSVLVTSYTDEEVTGSTPPQAGYYTTRRGNNYIPESGTNPYEKRQNSWCISVEEGRLTYYINQTQPSTTDDNYGIAIGKLPDILPIQKVGKVGEIGIYVKDLLVENLTTIKWAGNVRYITIDKGEWDREKAFTTNKSEYFYTRETSDNVTTYTRVEVTHNGCVWRSTGNLSTDGAIYLGKSDVPTLGSTHWVFVSGSYNDTIYYTTSETDNLNEGGVGLGSDVPYWRTDQSFFLKEYLDESDVSDASDEGLNPWYYCEFRPYMWRKVVRTYGTTNEEFVTEAAHIIGVFGETGRNYIIQTNVDYIPIEDESVERTLIIETFAENGGVRAEFPCYCKVVKVAGNGTETILNNDSPSYPAGHYWEIEDVEILPTDVAIEIYINSNGIDIKETYIAKKQIVIQKAVKGDKGDKGDNGYAGALTRVFQDELIYGFTYYSEASDVVIGTSVANYHYQDYIAVPCDGYQSGYIVFKCVDNNGYTFPTTAQHPAGDKFKISETYKTAIDIIGFMMNLSGGLSWEEVNVNAASAFFTNLIAQNAYIRMLTGSNFVITDNLGHVLAGMGNMTLHYDESDESDAEDEGKNYYIWAGGQNGSDAKFRVDADGSVKMNNGTFGGWTYHIPKLITVNNIMNYVKLTSAMLLNENTALYERTNVWELDIMKTGPCFALYDEGQNASNYLAQKLSYESNGTADQLYIRLPWYATYIDIHTDSVNQGIHPYTDLVTNSMLADAHALVNSDIHIYNASTANLFINGGIITKSDNLNSIPTDIPYQVGSGNINKGYEFYAKSTFVQLSESVSNTAYAGCALRWVRQEILPNNESSLFYRDDVTHFAKEE